MTTLWVRKDHSIETAILNSETYLGYLWRLCYWTCHTGVTSSWERDTDGGAGHPDNRTLYLMQSCRPVLGMTFVFQCIGGLLWFPWIGLDNSVWTLNSMLPLQRIRLMWRRLVPLLQPPGLFLHFSSDSPPILGSRLVQEQHRVRIDMETPIFWDVEDRRVVEKLGAPP